MTTPILPQKYRTLWYAPEPGRVDNVLAHGLHARSAQPVVGRAMRQQARLGCSVAALVGVWWCLVACAPAPVPPTAAATDEARASSAAPPTRLPDLPTVRVGVAPISVLGPTFIAQDKRSFADENLDVRLEQIASGPEGFAAAATGYLEVTSTS